MYINLYFGDNGAHVFWESEDNSVLIFRNHHEVLWITFIDKEMQEKSYRRLVDAVKNASKICGKKCILDHSKVWVQPRDGRKKRMELIADRRKNVNVG